MARVVQSASARNAVNSSTVTVTMTNPVKSGNLLVYFVNSATNAVIPVTAGFTLTGDHTEGATQSCTAAWKKAVAADEKTTFALTVQSVSSAVQHGAILYEIADWDWVSATPFNGRNSQTGSGTGSLTTPSLTPTKFGCLPLCFFSQHASGATFSAPGWTEDGKFNTTLPAFEYQEHAATVDTSTAFQGTLTSSNTSAWFGVILLIGPQISDGVRQYDPPQALSFFGMRSPVARLSPPKPAFTPRTFQVALSSTEGNSAILIKSVGKLLKGTDSTTVTIVRSIGKKMIGGHTVGVSTVTGESSAIKMVRKIGKILSPVNEANAATLFKGISKAPWRVTEGNTARLVKSVGKKLAVTRASVVVMVKSVGKRFVVTEGNTVKVQRQVGKRLSVSEGSTLKLIKRVGKLLAVARASVARMVTSKTYNRSLAATSLTTPKLSKGLSKKLAISSGNSVKMRKIVYLTRFLTQNNHISMKKGIFKQISVISSSSPLMHRLLNISVRMAITAANAVTMRRRISVNRQVLAATTPRMSKTTQYLRRLAVAAANNAKMRKQVGKNLRIGAGWLVSLVKSISKTLRVQQSPLANLIANGRAVQRATVHLFVQMVKTVSKTLGMSGRYTIFVPHSSILTETVPMSSVYHIFIPGEPTLGE